MIRSMAKPEPIANPRESRALDKVIFAARWGGFCYVVRDSSGTYFQVTDKPLGREIVYREADIIDGYNRDDLGESPDF